jgi:hypothetical protein
LSSSVLVMKTRNLLKRVRRRPKGACTVRPLKGRIAEMARQRRKYLHRPLGPRETVSGVRT